MTPADRMIEMVWLISGSMRRHGKLTAARLGDPACRQDGLAMAELLGSSAATNLFSAQDSGGEQHVFDMFAGLCEELRPL